MRLNACSIVLLPQPDGPMKAVMRLRAIGSVTFSIARNAP